MLLVSITFIAYFPALTGSRLWDDDGHITRPILQSAHGLWRIWFEVGASQQYYPLLHSAFWIEHRLWGDATPGYHLINVALHAASALLVVAIVKRLKLPGAWLAGFLFALHPVCVEAVAWISEQKSTLSAVFYLAALLVYLRFDTERKRSQYALATLLFVLALLSKTVTATLPAALLLIFWWQRGRLDSHRDIKPLLPWFALGVAAGLFTAWVEHTYIGAQGSGYALTFPERFLLAGHVLWFYLGKVLWPANLMFFYPRWTSVSPFWTLAALAAIAALVWLSKKNRAPLAAFLFFAGTLFPVLGFFNVYPFVYSYVADHFQYLATLGVIVPVAALLATYVRPQAAAAILVALLAALTWRETRMYRDLETLYTETLTRNPDSWIAHNNLGNYLLDKPARLSEAVRHFQTAEKLNPGSAEPHNNLGSAYSKMPGRTPDAITEFETALRLRPAFALAHNNLGTSLSKTPGRMPDALEHLRKAVELDPYFVDSHVNYGSALSSQPGRGEEAIAQYQMALELDPRSAEAHDDLAVALSQLPGHEQEAIGHYEAALASNPRSAEAHSNYGTALSDAGKFPEAIEQFETSLRLKPDSPDTHTSLGAALSRMPGRMPDAVREFETALRLNPDSAEANNDLGTTFAQAGRMKEAIQHFERSVRANPNFAEARINLASALEEVPGRLPEAIENLQAAVRLKPGFAEAHYQLALALARAPGRTAEAITEFDAALRIKPDPETQKLVEQLRRRGH